MPYGIRIFDDGGNTILDITERTPRLKTIVTGITVGTLGSTSTISVSGAATTDIAITDSGAPAQVTSTNTVNIYGTTGGTTTLKLLALY